MLAVGAWGRAQRPPGTLPVGAAEMVAMTAYRSPESCGVRMRFTSRPEDAAGLPGGVSRFSLHTQPDHAPLPRATAAAKPPRAMPGKEPARGAARVARNVSLHGASPWHPTRGNLTSNQWRLLNTGKNRSGVSFQLAKFLYCQFPRLAELPFWQAGSLPHDFFSSLCRRPRPV